MISSSVIFARAHKKRGVPWRLQGSWRRSGSGSCGCRLRTRTIRRPSISINAASWWTSSWTPGSPISTRPAATTAASRSGPFARPLWSATRATRSPSPRSCRRGLRRTPTRPAPCSTPPLRSAALTTSTITCYTTWARPSRRPSTSTACGSSAPRRRPRGRSRSSASLSTTTPRSLSACWTPTPRWTSCSCRSTTWTGRAISSSRANAMRYARSAGFPWSSWSR